MVVNHLLRSSVAVLSVILLSIGLYNVLHPDHEETLLDDMLTVFKLPLEFDEDFSPACASISGNGHLLAFQSSHVESYGNSDIWLSYYQNGRWSEPENPGPGINTSGREFDGKLSADGNEILFIRSDEEIKPSIYISTFRQGEWTEAESIGPPVSYPDQTEYGAIFSKDGNRLYFSSDRDGNYNGFDVYYSDRTNDGWSEPVNLGPAINSKGDAIDVAIGRNEKTIIIAFPDDESDSGQKNLYISKKTEEGWSSYQSMGPRFNTPGNEACPWLTYDGHMLLVNTTWDGLIHGKEMNDTRWGGIHSFHSLKGFD